MKKLHCILLVVIIFLSSNKISNAQLQQGNVMVGSNITNLKLGFGSASNFAFELNPKVAYFVKNNFALGAYFNFNYTKFSGVDGIFGWGAGVMGRYYIAKNEIYNPLNDGRFFLDGNIGLGGQTGVEVGLDIAVGPGYAYFITENVAIEGLAQLHTTLGTGSYIGLKFGVGLQIHLPISVVNDEYKKVRTQL